MMLMWPCFSQIIIYIYIYIHIYIYILRFYSRSFGELLQTVTSTVDKTHTDLREAVTHSQRLSSYYAALFGHRKYFLTTWNFLSTARQTDGNWMETAQFCPHSKNQTSFDQHNIWYNPSVLKLYGEWCYRILIIAQYYSYWPCRAPLSGSVFGFWRHEVYAVQSSRIWVTSF
jgi:hypothetical protein